MANVRVKICGITRIEDALAAAAMGADAIGLVFYARSPRAVTAAQAQRIVEALPPFVTSVGLFVDAAPCEIEETLDAVPLDLLQFHGDETPAQCVRYRRPYLKAIRMRPEVDLVQVARDYAGARGLLLDTYVPGTPGGTGATFDWQRVPSDLEMPLILAGGLDAENVAAAIAQARPYGVDVSGGVELSKGIKDGAAIRRFMVAVRDAERM